MVANHQSDKSSPLIERNDLTLWAQANAVGGFRKEPPLISEDSEGVSYPSQMQNGRIQGGRKQDQQG